MESGFEGFGAESFGFFRELAQNNHKPWFDANRARYEQHVQGAFRSLLQELEPALLALNPHFETAGKTNGNFSRINRDIRFSKDKSPYKPNFYLYVFDGRHDRGYAGRLYVGLAAECVTAGFSIYATDRKMPGALKSVFRPRIARHWDTFERLLGDVVRRGRYESYWHRVEKKEWAQHPGLPRRVEDWLTLDAWIVRKVFEPEARALATPTFAQRVERIFRELYPLYVFTSVAGPRWRTQLRPRRLAN
ncbi:MAG TPA: DUF2461 domain-containing protein [Terriglobia bacterium]|nr:DUF2461 domain-containing protein [Terriglobia bacterium]